MSSKIGWRFPPTGGGTEAGINDPAISTFEGNPVSNLAREVLQNSVDARERIDKPVHVSFEIRQVRLDAFGGKSLVSHIEACAAVQDINANAKHFFETATSVLSGETVDALGIIDSNTTGLAGNAWRGLVKMMGASFKAEGAGGSFGVGKAAPFALSPLRTVFYWSRFKDGDRLNEQLQGKAVLISHQYDGATTQATGFYGMPEDCEPLESEHIHDIFRSGELDDSSGTAIWVLGFDPEQDGEAWQRVVARSVISSFFFAIAQGDLELLLEPDSQVNEDSDWVIDQQTLEKQFEKLSTNNEEDPINQSKLYWKLTRSEPTDRWKDPDLGSVRLWIGTNDDFPDVELPNRTALIRKTGMLITDQQDRHRFRGFRDYVAVCVFDDDQGNELLRRMENPTHDQFEFARLDGDSEGQRGRKALERLRVWLRERLKERASPTLSDVSEEIDELGEYLYADRPGAFEGKTSPEKVDTSNKEQSFGQMADILRSPPRQQPNVVATLSVDDGEEEGHLGDDSGVHGGRGSGLGGKRGEASQGGGDGDGVGGSGGLGGNRGGPRTLELTDVRVLIDADNPTRGRISFISLESAHAVLRMQELGDSSPIQRDDVELRSPEENGGVVDQVHLVAGERYFFNLSGKEDLRVAWQLSALPHVAQV